jgi:hypothetical protein
LSASQLPQATETAIGAAEIATQVESDAGVDNTRIITPAKLATATPTMNRVPRADGSGKLASGWGGAANSLATLDGATRIPSAQLPQATETVVGAAEVATQVEVDAGVDDLRIVTPLKMASTSSMGTTVPTADRIPKALSTARLRRGWLPSGEAFVDFYEISPATVITVNDVGGVRFVDGQTRSARGQRHITSVIDLTVNPVLSVSIIVSSTGSGNGNADFTVEARYFADGELTSKAADETLPLVVAITNTLGRRHVVTTPLDRTKMGSGRLVHFKVTRAGSSGVDTYDGDLMLTRTGLISFGTA